MSSNDQKTGRMPVFRPITPPVLDDTSTTTLPSVSTAMTRTATIPKVDQLAPLGSVARLQTSLSRTQNYQGETTKAATIYGEEVTLRHGRGMYTYSTTSTDQAQPNGQSRSQAAERSVQYEYSGDWVLGIKHGGGVLKLPDGSWLEGNFVQGEFTGLGIRRWPDGSYVTGKFTSGDLNGPAVWIGRPLMIQPEVFYPLHRPLKPTQMRWYDSGIVQAFLKSRFRHRLRDSFAMAKTTPQNSVDGPNSTELLGVSVSTLRSEAGSGYYGTFYQHRRHTVRSSALLLANSIDAIVEPCQPSVLANPDESFGYGLEVYSPRILLTKDAPPLLALDEELPHLQALQLQSGDGGNSRGSSAITPADRISYPPKVMRDKYSDILFSTCFRSQPLTLSAELGDSSPIQRSIRALLKASHLKIMQAPVWGLMWSPFRLGKPDTWPRTAGTWESRPLVIGVEALPSRLYIGEWKMGAPHGRGLWIGRTSALTRSALLPVLESFQALGDPENRALRAHLAECIYSVFPKDAASACLEAILAGMPPKLVLESYLDEFSRLHDALAYDANEEHDNAGKRGSQRQAPQLIGLWAHPFFEQTRFGDQTVDLVKPIEVSECNTNPNLLQIPDLSASTHTTLWRRRMQPVSSSGFTTNTALPPSVTGSGTPTLASSTFQKQPSKTSYANSETSPALGPKRQSSRKSIVGISSLQLLAPSKSLSYQPADPSVQCKEFYSSDACVLTREEIAAKAAPVAECQLGVIGGRVTGRPRLLPSMPLPSVAIVTAAPSQHTDENASMDKPHGVSSELIDNDPDEDIRKFVDQGDETLSSKPAPEGAYQGRKSALQTAFEESGRVVGISTRLISGFADAREHRGQLMALARAIFDPASVPTSVGAAVGSSMSFAGAASAALLSASGPPGSKRQRAGVSLILPSANTSQADSNSSGGMSLPPSIAQQAVQSAESVFSSILPYPPQAISAAIVAAIRAIALAAPNLLRILPPQHLAYVPEHVLERFKSAANAANRPLYAGNTLPPTVNVPQPVAATLAAMPNAPALQPATYFQPAVFQLLSQAIASLEAEEEVETVLGAPDPEPFLAFSQPSNVNQQIADSVKGSHKQRANYSGRLFLPNFGPLRCQHLSSRLGSKPDLCARADCSVCQVHQVLSTPCGASLNADAFGFGSEHGSQVSNSQNVSQPPAQNQSSSGSNQATSTHAVAQATAFVQAQVQTYVKALIGETASQQIVVLGRLLVILDAQLHQLLLAMQRLSSPLCSCPKRPPELIRTLLLHSIAQVVWAPHLLSYDATKTGSNEVVNSNALVEFTALESSVAAEADQLRLDEGEDDEQEDSLDGALDDESLEKLAVDLEQNESPDEGSASDSDLELDEALDSTSTTLSRFSSETARLAHEWGLVLMRGQELALKSQFLEVSKTDPSNTFRMQMQELFESPQSGPKGHSLTERTLLGSTWVPAAELLARLNGDLGLREALGDRPLLSFYTIQRLVQLVVSQELKRYNRHFEPMSKSARQSTLSGAMTNTGRLEQDSDEMLVSVYLRRVRVHRERVSQFRRSVRQKRNQLIVTLQQQQQQQHHQHQQQQQQQQQQQATVSQSAQPHLIQIAISTELTPTLTEQQPGLVGAGATVRRSSPLPAESQPAPGGVPRQQTHAKVVGRRSQVGSRRQDVSPPPTRDLRGPTGYRDLPVPRPASRASRGFRTRGAASRDQQAQKELEQQLEQQRLLEQQRQLEEQRASMQKALMAELRRRRKLLQRKKLKAQRALHLRTHAVSAKLYQPRPYNRITYGTIRRGKDRAQLSLRIRKFNGLAQDPMATPGKASKEKKLELASDDDVDEPCMVNALTFLSSFMFEYRLLRLYTLGTDPIAPIPGSMALAIYGDSVESFGVNSTAHPGTSETNQPANTNGAQVSVPTSNRSQRPGTAAAQVAGTSSSASSSSAGGPVGIPTSVNVSPTGMTNVAGQIALMDAMPLPWIGTMPGLNGGFVDPLTIVQAPPDLFMSAPFTSNDFSVYASSRASSGKLRAVLWSSEDFHVAKVLSSGLVPVATQISAFSTCIPGYNATFCVSVAGTPNALQSGVPSGAGVVPSSLPAPSAPQSTTQQFSGPTASMTSGISPNSMASPPLPPHHVSPGAAAALAATLASYFASEPVEPHFAKTLHSSWFAFSAVACVIGKAVTSGGSAANPHHQSSAGNAGASSGLVGSAEPSARPLSSIPQQHGSSSNQSTHTTSVRGKTGLPHMGSTQELDEEAVASRSTKVSQLMFFRALLPFYLRRFQEGATEGPTSVATSTIPQQLLRASSLQCSYLSSLDAYSLNTTMNSPHASYPATALFAAASHVVNETQSLNASSAIPTQGQVEASHHSSKKSIASTSHGSLASSSTGQTASTSSQATLLLRDVAACVVACLGMLADLECSVPRVAMTTAVLHRLILTRGDCRVGPWTILEQLGVGADLSSASDVLEAMHILSLCGAPKPSFAYDLHASTRPSLPSTRTSVDPPYLESLGQPSVASQDLVKKHLRHIKAVQAYHADKQASFKLGYSNYLMMFHQIASSAAGRGPRQATGPAQTVTIGGEGLVGQKENPGPSSGSLAPTSTPSSASQSPLRTMNSSTPPFSGVHTSASIRIPPPAPFQTLNSTHVAELTPAVPSSFISGSAMMFTGKITSQQHPMALTAQASALLPDYMKISCDLVSTGATAESTATGSSSAAASQSSANSSAETRLLVTPILTYFHAKRMAQLIALRQMANTEGQSQPQSSVRSGRTSNTTHPSNMLLRTPPTTIAKDTASHAELPLSARVVSSPNATAAALALLVSPPELSTRLLPNPMEGTDVLVHFRRFAQPYAAHVATVDPTFCLALPVANQLPIAAPSGVKQTGTTSTGNASSTVQGAFIGSLGQESGTSAEQVYLPALALATGLANLDAAASKPVQGLQSLPSACLSAWQTWASTHLSSYEQSILSALSAHDIISGFMALPAARPRSATAYIERDSEVVAGWRRAIRGTLARNEVISQQARDSESESVGTAPRRAAHEASLQAVLGRPSSPDVKELTKISREAAVAAVERTSSAARALACVATVAGPAPQYFVTRKGMEICTKHSYGSMALYIPTASSLLWSTSLYSPLPYPSMAWTPVPYIVAPTQEASTKANPAATAPSVSTSPTSTPMPALTLPPLSKPVSLPSPMGRTLSSTSSPPSATSTAPTPSSATSRPRTRRPSLAAVSMTMGSPRQGAASPPSVITISPELGPLEALDKVALSQQLIQQRRLWGALLHIRTSPADPYGGVANAGGSSSTASNSNNSSGMLGSGASLFSGSAFGSLNSLSTPSAATQGGTPSQSGAALASGGNAVVHLESHAYIRMQCAEAISSIALHTNAFVCIHGACCRVCGQTTSPMSLLRLIPWCVRNVPLNGRNEHALVQASPTLSLILSQDPVVAQVLRHSLRHLIAPSTVMSRFMGYDRMQVCLSENSQVISPLSRDDAFGRNGISPASSFGYTVIDTHWGASTTALRISRHGLVFPHALGSHAVQAEIARPASLRSNDESSPLFRFGHLLKQLPRSTTSACLRDPFGPSVLVTPETSSDAADRECAGTAVTLPLPLRLSMDPACWSGTRQVFPVPVASAVLSGSVPPVTGSLRGEIVAQDVTFGLSSNEDDCTKADKEASARLADANIYSSQMDQLEASQPPSIRRACPVTIPFAIEP